MVYMVTLFKSALILAGFISSLTSACQLDDNCKLVKGLFDSSTVCNEPKAFSPLLLHFIEEPSNQIAEQTNTTITFQCAVAPVSDYQVNFLWKFNGQEIEDNIKDVQVASETFSSRLEVKVSNSAEGSYQCIVYSKQLKYNVASRYGYLKIADCFDGGWIDTLLPSFNTHNNTVELLVSKESTTILECTPNVTLSSSYTTWLINNNATLDSDHIKLPNGALLVRNFNPSSNTKVTYRCVVVSNSCPQLTREFNLRATSEKPPSIVSNNQTALLGSLVLLYCITNGKTSNTWYKDGQRLGSSLNRVIFGQLNEVLVIHNVTMETEGEYSCVENDHTVMTMQLDVLIPPTLASIHVLGHTPINQSLVLPFSPSIKVLHLSCETDIHHSVSYTWFFEGNPITASLDVAFTQADSLLFVTGVDVFGSYQCVVANKGGSAAAMLFVVKDKPDPPSSITIVRDSDLNVSRPTNSYQYTITVNPPLNQLIHERLYTYHVEAYIHRSSDSQYNYCSCNSTSESSGVISFVANDFAEVITKHFYVRVAVVSSTSGVMSDFLPYTIDSDCGSKIDLVAPHRPTDLVNVPSRTAGGWNELFHWKAPSNQNYPFKLYETHLALQCEGLETLNEVVLSSISIYKLSNTLPCCTSCNLTVSFVTINSEFSSSITSNFKTQSISPNQPPVINFVERNISNGQSVCIDIILPPANVSCGASRFTVHYTDSETFDSQPLSECQLVEGPDTLSAGRYQCATKVDTQFCWQALNFSVTIGNDLGWSEKSQPKSLSGISEDILQQHSTLFVSKISEETLTVSLQTNNGLDCLLSNTPFTASVCISSTLSDSASCGFLSGLTLSYTFTDLNWNTRYFIEGRLSVLDVQNVTLQSVRAATSFGIPNAPPRNLTITQLDSGKLSLLWLEPDEEKLHGSVSQYLVKIVDSLGNKSNFNTTNLSLKLGPPPEGVEYQSVSIRACTIAGCGPNIIQNFPTTVLKSDLTAVEKVALGCGVGILVISVLIFICLIFCVCAVKKRRKKNYEQLDRQQLYNSNEDLTDNDLVSIGDPDGAASMHSDHTELDKIPNIANNPVKKVEMYMYMSRKIDDVASDLKELETTHESHDRCLNEPSVTTPSQQNDIRPSPQETWNEENGTKLLIGNEQQTNKYIVSSNDQEDSPISRVSRFGYSHLQTSPLDAAAKLSHNRPICKQSDTTCISMDLLADYTEENRTRDFIGVEIPQMIESLDMQRKQSNVDAPTNSSGYVETLSLPVNDHSTGPEPGALSLESVDHHEHFSISDNHNMQLETSQCDSGGYIDANETTLHLKLSTNEELKSGQNCNPMDVILPSSSPHTSNNWTHSLEDLSQNSSVFDESINASTSNFRSTLSSGVYSTSSVENGYVESVELSRYRSSSEGYSSPRPSSPAKKFLYNVSAGDSQISSSRLSAQPNTCLNQEQSTDPCNYLNIQDVYIHTISMTMDQETKDRACRNNDD